MKALLTTMNLPRFVILIGFLATAVLAWFDYEMGLKLDYLKDAESIRAPRLVRSIQSHSMRLTSLQEQLQDDVWLGQNNPGLYARTIAQDAQVLLGQVDVLPSRDERVVEGVIDKKYTIRPVNKDRGWGKDKIGNFLYLLEAKSQRVRVTRVKIQQPAKRRTKNFEIPPDEWTYEVEITSRQRE